MTKENEKLLDSNTKPATTCAHLSWCSGDGCTSDQLWDRHVAEPVTWRMGEDDVEVSLAVTHTADRTIDGQLVEEQFGLQMRVVAYGADPVTVQMSEEDAVELEEQLAARLAEISRLRG